MSERTTINVSKDAHRKASEAKRDDESWSDYIQRCADTNPNQLDPDALEDALDQISMANDPGVTIDTEEVLREVGKAVELAEQARDNTQELKENLR